MPLKKRKVFIKDTVAECTQSKDDAPKVSSSLSFSSTFAGVLHIGWWSSMDWG